ncbi:type 1 glutamine amidotransferase domain-containing protein [Thalassotalea agarivorans]|uniref:Putative intracellular protease/amidase n=1 Tax=Thalassotalea agarivorans TaxID=349064 RepID=A0A1I0HP83_THASX|nr:type 1 glutamine amidotransferase domain-containing protein [Thalassotalea agarivorans]SET85762.1 Putative intracellular protease/amidase [Thalassotalea agarivorans]
MKTKFQKNLAITLFTLICSLGNSAQADNKNILMVLSSYGEKNEQGELIKPGYEFDEMSKSYLVFKSAGTNVTFASPSGGELITDNFDTEKPYNKQFLTDQQAVTLLKQTKSLSTINPNMYDAIYVVGGKGPMYDLAKDQKLKQLIKSIYEQNGIVAAVCHGPAALLDIKLSNGEYLLAGKRISAFTNLEEQAFTKKWQLPFSLEDQIKAQGAQLIKDGLMLNQVSIDGRLVTGQNPFSTADSAIAVVEKLGLATDNLPQFKDDNTIKLVEQFYVDSQAAKQTFETSKQDYSPMLLAMFGVYQSKYANTEAERNVALMLMELTSKDIDHPMLYTAIAQTYLDQNNPQQAINVLKHSKTKFPENEQINILLDEATKS